MTKAEKLAKLEEMKNPHMRLQSFLIELETLKAVGRLDLMRGEKGENGYTPVKGKDYFTDEEIASIIKYIQEGILPGEKGEPGKNGQTPFKGIDYWTKEDQEKIIKEVLSKIKIPEVKNGKDVNIEEIVTRTSEELSKKFNIKAILNDPQLRMLLHGGGSSNGGGSSTFTALTDAPNSYSGQAGKTVRVNSSETGLEFSSGSGSGGSGGSGVTWNNVTTTSQSAAVNNGYITNNAALVTVTLPATAAIGDYVLIQGSGAGGWRLAQNAGQSIAWNAGGVAGVDITTTGVTGHLQSTDRYDSVEVMCITANTGWVVRNAKGNLSIN